MRKLPLKKCTDSSCDYEHPSEDVNHKTIEGCIFDDKFAFRHTGNSNSSNKKKKRMDIPQVSIGMIRNIKSLGKYLRIVKHCQKERFDVRTWDGRSEEEWWKIVGDRSQTAIFLPSLNMCIVFKKDKCHPLMLCRMVLHIRVVPTHRHLKKEMRIMHCGQKKTREKKP